MLLRSAAALCASAILASCAGFIPTIGPSSATIEKAKTPVGLAQIQVIDVDATVTEELLSERKQQLFSKSLETPPHYSRLVGPGDVLEVTIWEAAPATLFGNSMIAMAGGIAPSQATTLPAQMVDDEGYISVPFAGRILAAGKTLEEIEAEIVSGLKGKANQPQVLVRRTQDFSANATVVGDVNRSTRVALVPGNDRLLDALAEAGGVKEPVNKVTIQVTRGEKVYSLPLETIIRDPHQDVNLLPGDVVTALYQPYSFMALGATGKDEEINFETQGISVAQALARSGGLLDERSNPKGVFVFRFVPKDALVWPHPPVMTTPDGMVPVVFRIDLTKPSSFFLIQSFPMQDKDILYVSNAPVTEMQKFFNLLFTVAYPVLTAKQVGAF
ncbi:MAG: polysaccharide biosynthesis/export family protein [Steroidobacteraceae bacterium]